jgi:hypothetical protein
MGPVRERKATPAEAFDNGERRRIMTCRQLCLRGAVSGLLIALLASAGQAALEYTFVDLGTGPPGFTSASLLGGGGGQLVGAAKSPSIGAFGHAVLWPSAGAPPIDLHPTGYAGSGALAADGTQQAGYAFSGIPPNHHFHAMVWSGAAVGAVDLHPSGFTESYAQGVSEGQQVGYASGPGTGDNPHAIVWSGSASSFIDLNPTGYTSSGALGVYAGRQAGAVGGPQTGIASHAALWSGTPESFVDLNPAWLASSGLMGIYGDQQVGLGTLTPGVTHAFLWRDTAESAVDLHPEGYEYSAARATNGRQQVGEVLLNMTGSYYHAMVWSGMADTAVDLQEFTPSVYQWSTARAIDSCGNVFGYVSVDGGSPLHAAEWILVPEPATLILFMIAQLVSGGGGLRGRIRNQGAEDY